MPQDFQPIFAELKRVFAPHATSLRVTNDSAILYTLTGRVPSPFPQHKGKPMWVGEVRLGKAYVSFHLMPLYLHDALAASISPALKKRMQGKTCFNFRTMPEAELVNELKRLTEAGVQCFRDKRWV